VVKYPAACRRAKRSIGVRNEEESLHDAKLSKCFLLFLVAMAGMGGAVGLGMLFSIKLPVVVGLAFWLVAASTIVLCCAHVWKAYLSAHCRNGSGRPKQGW